MTILVHQTEPFTEQTSQSTEKVMRFKLVTSSASYVRL